MHIRGLFFFTSLSLFSQLSLLTTIAWNKIDSIKTRLSVAYSRLFNYLNNKNFNDRNYKRQFSPRKAPVIQFYVIYNNGWYRDYNRRGGLHSIMKRVLKKIIFHVIITIVVSQKWKLIKREDDQYLLSRRCCEIIGSSAWRPEISGTRTSTFLRACDPAG